MQGIPSDASRLEFWQSVDFVMLCIQWIEGKEAKMKDGV